MSYDAALSNKFICSFYIDVSAHLTKKNNRPIYRNGKSGALFLGKNLKLQSAERDMLMQMVKIRDQKKLKTIDYPIWSVFRFIFPREKYFTKKGHRNKKLPDLSNLYQLPEDLLQKANIITDDNLISSHDFSRRVPGDKYLLEIHLLKFEENNHAG